MQRHFIGLVLALAAATAFGEDATTSPATVNAPATAGTPSVSTTNITAEPAADKTKATFNGYRLVKKEGQDDKYCRKQKVTGSRTKVIESCLTLEEITVLRESSQSVVRDAVRNQGTSVQEMNTGNGTQPSAVTF
jgi:hypothetical protein